MMSVRMVVTVPVVIVVVVDTLYGVTAKTIIFKLTAYYLVYHCRTPFKTFSFVIHNYRHYLQNAAFKIKCLYPLI